MQSEEKVLRTLLPQEQTGHVVGTDGCIAKHAMEEDAQSP